MSCKPDFDLDYHYISNIFECRTIGEIKAGSICGCRCAIYSRFGCGCSEIGKSLENHYALRSELSWIHYRLLSVDSCVQKGYNEA